MTKCKAQSACQGFTAIIHETGFNFGGIKKKKIQLLIHTALIAQLDTNI